MELVPVASSMLSTVGYDDATGELAAHFHDGAAWRYKGVPREVYEQLLKISAKGGYLRDLIIDVCPDYRVRQARR